jgi:hypothetical protein
MLRLEEAETKTTSSSSTNYSRAEASAYTTKRFTNTFNANDYTTSADNFTNVTQFSHMLTTFNAGSGHEDMELVDDDRRAAGSNATLIRNTEGAAGGSTSFYGAGANETKVIFIFVINN